MRPQRALMKHVQLRQTMNHYTRKKVLPTFMLDDTPHALSTGSTLPIYQDPELCLHPLDTMRAVIKL